MTEVANEAHTCLQFEREQREEAGGTQNSFSGDGPSSGILTFGQTVAGLLTFGSHAMVSGPPDWLLWNNPEV